MDKTDPKPNMRFLSVEEWLKLSQNMLENGQLATVKFTVNGNSMYPLIRIHRDEVTLAPITREIRVGDIVLFAHKRPTGDYVLHRVHAINGGMVQTFGDGCLRPDAWMKHENVLGIAVSIQRGKRTIDPYTKKSMFLFGIWNALLPIRRPILCVMRRFNAILIRFGKNKRRV